MAIFIKSVSDAYNEYMAMGDPRVTSWMFMESPIPIFTLVVLYVLFVKKIGTAWMMNKKPFDLRYTMVLYNLALVFTSMYIIHEMFAVMLNSNLSWTCGIEHDKNHPAIIRLKEVSWLYFVLKVVEFADTIFFVLRKKNQNISTLHVVHHAVVPICVWALLRNESGSYNYFFPLINSIVHAIMYSYYGLAALGPSVQRYLWWKKYLTTIQMIQFFMVLSFILMLIISTNCKISKHYIYLNTFMAGLFLVMFYDYYRKTYYFKNRAMQKPKYIDAANSAAKGKKIAADLEEKKKKPFEKKID